jgi:hypothetical protein
MISGIALFLFSLYLLYLLMAHALPVSISLALYLVGACYSFWRLQLQLSRRYQLTGASALTLVGLALFALLLTGAIAQAGVAGLLSFISVLPVFLASCVLTLEVWGLTKWLPYLMEVRRCQQQIREQTQQLEAVAREQAKLSRRVQRLERRYSSLLRERGELQRIIEELSLHDPENLTLKRRQWQEEFVGLSGKGLRRAKREAISQLREVRMRARGPEAAQISLAVKACLLRLEEIERASQLKALREAQQALERKAREEQKLRQELAQAQQELVQQEAAYRAFRASRIVLD